MRTRLAQSEPTTVWFALWDKVISEANLQTAYWSVWYNGGAAGADGQTVAQFDEQEQAELAKLRAELLGKRYRRQPARRVWIPKPGTQEKRPLGIPAVRDRTVEAALKSVLEPIFEQDFAEHSYGFRPGRGCREAVQRVEELLKQGRTWCVDLDFKSYFDTMDHPRLLGLVKQRVVDGSVLALLEQSLKAGVLEELQGWQPTEHGTPQGAVISPLLANLYLTPLDHQMAQKGYEMVRYADDLVVLCRSQEEAEQALTYLRQWSAEAGLTVHPTKTRVVNVQSEGFDFLGWHFGGGSKWPRQKSLEKLRDKLRPLTRRTNGRSLSEMIAKANPILRGWYDYFPGKPSHGLERSRWMVATPPPSAVAPTGEATRIRVKRGRPPTVAEPVVWAQGWCSLEHGSCAYGSSLGETTDWRAECPRWASPVRREGWREPRHPYR